MKGYINVPESMDHRQCLHCGSKPVIMLADRGLYVVKCPADDAHYQTSPGIINIEDWNRNNTLSMTPKSDPGL